MYDVAIIGAGITGCAIAYELGKYNVKAVIVEKENDVSVGTTKANSAIIHGGYDPKPGTKMAESVCPFLFLCPLTGLFKSPVISGFL